MNFLNNNQATFELVKQNDVDINALDDEGNTQLMRASFEGNKAAVNLLIEKGARLDLKDKYERSPLMLASFNNHHEIVSVLIANGLDINAKDIYGRTTLIYAANNNSADIVKLLINNGVDQSITSEENYTAYDFAVMNNCIPIMFLFNKQIINQQDGAGDTLLIKACRKKDETNIMFLYEKDADFFMKNKRGVSAFDVLKSTDSLPKKLQALKENLMLEQDINDNLEISCGL